MKMNKSFVLKYSEVLLGLVLLFFIYQFVWSKPEWQNEVLSSDGRGYYAYLPSIVLFQDLSYEKNKLAIEQQLGYEMSHHCILEDEKGNRFNKTFPGVSILQLPFFLLSIVVAWLAGFPVNGYSEPFLIGIQLSAWLAALVGFYAIRKSLTHFGLLCRDTVLVAGLTVLGTNVFYYATAVPSMGHVYSFMLLSLFLYTSIQVAKIGQLKQWLLLGFIIGMIILVRPTNVVVLLVFPFVWYWFNPSIKWWKGMWLKRQYVVVALIAFSGVVSILPLLWFAQTGQWLVWSYTGEGFYWLSPQPIKVLFSFRNGLFIWTPIALLSFVGWWYGWKKLDNKWSGLWLVAYFVLNLYIISAWWTHYYDGGFGHRVYVDHQFFTAFLLGLSVLYASKYIRITLISVSVLLVGLNIGQAIQLNKGILPQDYVNGEMYRLLFLKFDDKWKGECNATLDCRQFGKVVQTDYLRPINDQLELEIHFSRDRAFGGDVHYEVPRLDETTVLFLEVKYDKYRISEEPFNEVLFVVDGINEHEETVYYEARPLYHIRSEAYQHWKSLNLTLQLPKHQVSQYKFYIWNSGQRAFKVKNIDLRIHHIRP
jgi:hypothetical protein